MLALANCFVGIDNLRRIEKLMSRGVRSVQNEVFSIGFKRRQLAGISYRAWQTHLGKRTCFFVTSVIPNFGRSQKCCSEDRHQQGRQVEEESAMFCGNRKSERDVTCLSCDAIRRPSPLETSAQESAVVLQSPTVHGKPPISDCT